MDRIKDLEIFLAIVAEGSLARAGQRLGMSPPAITRALSRLEERLNAALFVRTTRRLSLTPAGDALVPRAKEVLDAMEMADAAVAEGQTLRGMLSLTAPRQFGRIVIAPIVNDFLKQHASVNARLVLADRMVHFLDEGVDLAVRIGALSDTTSIARRVGFVRQYVVASPAYLAQHGRPSALADLSEHRLVAFKGHLVNGQLRVAGGRVPFAPFHIEVDCAATALELAEVDAGLAALWSYQCAAAIRAGTVEPVLTEFMPPPTPCHCVWPERRFENPLVRAFVDFAAPKIGARLSNAADLAR